MPDPMTFPLQCPSCGRPFSVAVQEPVKIQPRQQRVKCVVECPYPNCAGKLEPLMIGEVVSVWAGHGRAPSKYRVH